MAWEVVKMPVYHGTTAENAKKIMQEGLKPTDHAPQLYDFDMEQIQEALGFDDQQMEDIFGGDWNFFYGDKAKPSLSTMGGKQAAISSAMDWVDGMMGGEEEGGGPVVLEIDDRHPDSPFFMPEPRIRPDEQAFNEFKDQRRSNKVIPPHLIRQLSQDEVDRAIQSEEDYYTANEERADLMTEIINRIARSHPNQYLEEEFDHALDQRKKLQSLLSSTDLRFGLKPPYWEKKSDLPRPHPWEGLQ